MKLNKNKTTRSKTTSNPEEEILRLEILMAKNHIVGVGVKHSGRWFKQKDRVSSILSVCHLQAILLSYVRPNSKHTSSKKL